MQFLLVELGCKGSLTAENCLTLRDRIQQSSLERALKEYISFTRRFSLSFHHCFLFFYYLRDLCLLQFLSLSSYESYQS